MTVQETELRQAHLQALPHFAGAHRAIPPLAGATALYALLAAALAAALHAPLPPAAGVALGQLRQDGALGIVLAALLLACGGTAACLAMAAARRSASPDMTRGQPRAPGPVTALLARVGRRRGVRSGPAGFALARWLQAALVTGSALAALAALATLGPQSVAVRAAPAALRFGLAGGAVLLAFPLLIAERVLAALPSPSLPERPLLARLAILPIAALIVAAALQLLAGLGLDLAADGATLAGVVLGLAALELAARAAIGLLAPGVDRAGARAPVGSLLLAPLAPGPARHCGWAALLRERFGLDVMQSWALRFVAAAAPPVAAVLAAVCLLLAGAVRIDTGERGVYERLGVPVAVLRPGLHLILPWPLGRVRRVEYGTVHTVALGTGEAAPSPDAALLAVISGPLGPATAEGPPPPDANRLWDAAQMGDVAYLIASTSNGRPSFETISANVTVLYRVGLDDRSARRAAYGAADAETLVRSMASQLLARHLAASKLAAALGEDRTGIARRLQTALQRSLDARGTGVEIVAVIIEAIHPPGGAAAAYRNVQAAQIAAATAIAQERGRAETTTGVARQEAAARLDAAAAAAAERTSAAAALRTGLAADAAAWHADPTPFLLERSLAALRQALPAAELEILDHRLDGAAAPTFDLRPFDRFGPAPPRRRGPQDSEDESR